MRETERDRENETERNRETERDIDRKKEQYSHVLISYIDLYVFLGQ